MFEPSRGFLSQFRRRGNQDHSALMPPRFDQTARCQRIGIGSEVPPAEISFKGSGWAWALKVQGSLGPAGGTHLVCQAEMPRAVVGVVEASAIDGAIQLQPGRQTKCNTVASKSTSVNPSQASCGVTRAPSQACQG